MDKKELRQQGIQRMKKLALSPEMKASKEAEIYRKLFTSGFWQSSQTIGVVMSTSDELNTQPIIEQAWNEGKTVAVPRVLPKRQMTFLKIMQETKFQSAVFGIKEPLTDDEILKSELELILVPGVRFTKDGYRIGFGGGYYDRYLADFSGETCSLAFQEQLVEDWQPEMFDVPVQHLIIDELR